MPGRSPNPAKPTATAKPTAAARPRSAPKPKPPPDPARLSRTAAGRYATGDGRFVVEQSSGGWMITDAEQTNELGLPLVRGPYPTLDAARSALDDIRAGPAPISDLRERIAALPKSSKVAGPSRAPSGPASSKAKPPAPLPVVIREFRSRDGEGLRALWESAGLHGLGDDDMSLRRFAQRNPGLFIVAAQGADVVGSAMGAWDGRRGWIYHVATAAAHRRGGLARKIVRQIEAGLLAQGCAKVNVLIRDGNDAGEAFWPKLGYEPVGSRVYGRELGGTDEGEADD